MKRRFLQRDEPPPLRTTLFPCGSVASCRRTAASGCDGLGGDTVVIPHRLRIAAAAAPRPQKCLADKLEIKSAANMSQQLRRLDVKAALKKAPDELKHFLEEADATNT